MTKKKIPPVDGWSPKLESQIRSAVRKVWSYSHARRLVEKRCALPGGYARCEKCKKKKPKIYVDHSLAAGKVDSGFLRRMFVPSLFLQGLCKECHKEKTKLERLTERNFKKKKFLEKVCSYCGQENDHTHSFCPECERITDHCECF